MWPSCGGGVRRKQEADGRARERGGFLSRKLPLLIVGERIADDNDGRFQKSQLLCILIGQLFRRSTLCCRRLEFLAVGGIFNSPTSSSSYSPRANPRLVCLQRVEERAGDKERKPSSGRKHQKYASVLQARYPAFPKLTLVRFICLKPRVQLGRIR